MAKCFLNVCFETMTVVLVSFVATSRTRRFLKVTPILIFVNLRAIVLFPQSMHNASMLACVVCRFKQFERERTKRRSCEELSCLSPRYLAALTLLLFPNALKLLENRRQGTQATCMFPQCFLVLLYGKHCFQGQFLFPRSKICSQAC